MPTPPLARKSPDNVASSPYRVVDVLGPRLALYRMSRLMLAQSVAVSAISFVLTLFFLVPLLLGGYGDPAATFLSFFGAGCTFAVSVTSLRRFFLAKNTMVAVHESGLRFSDGKITREIPWDDVSSVWAELWEPIRAPMPELIVKMGLSGGPVLVFPKGLERAHELAEHVRDATAPRLLAEAEAALAEGKTISFGAVSLDGRALWIGKTRLPFSEVDAVRLSFRWLEIRHADGNHVLYPTRDVKNLGVLLALSGKFVRGRALSRG